ncbi:MAG: putA, partial [Burkholderia sp.]|nr:putA [Burkholderia sp.]
MNDLAAMAAPAADGPFAGLAADAHPAPDRLRQALRTAHRRDEAEAVAWLLSQVRGDDAERRQATALAARLVATVRNERSRASGVDALMQEFSLSSQEGIALMCLAEALLRIPDRETADRLIAEK